MYQMYSSETVELARHVIRECVKRNWMLSTAESCTGGLIIGALTEISGSSTVVDRGFVTYSNQAKVDMLGVDMSSIESNGAVSHEVAESMANGALKNAKTDISVAVTGVAGPGDSENKPAGLVYIGVASKNLETTIVTKNNFSGNRNDVRHGTVRTALFMMLSVLQQD